MKLLTSYPALEEEQELSESEDTMFSKLKRYSVVYASILAIVGAVLMFFAPLFFNLTRSFVLSLKTRQTYDLWRKTPMPLYLEFYFFNWTNPEDIYKPGVKPHFEEIGPFVFQETREKVNISWNDNNTITYRNLRYWYFKEDMSVANLSTEVTTINSAVVFAAHMIKDWSYIIKKGFYYGITSLSIKLYKRTTIGEVLFDGYEDPLISMKNSVPGVQSLKLPNYDKFGWFYARNGSYTFDGTFNIESGGENVGSMREWNYQSLMSYYEGDDCNEVKGSAGEFYSADIRRDKIGFFSPDICRYVPMDYKLDVTVDGTKGYMYVLGKSYLDNGTAVPENKCYCGEYCSPYGALNISMCRYGAPGFVSQPHFLDADPYYLDKISGLSPKKEKHGMYMIVEPNTGIPLDVKANLQLNVLVQPISGIGLLDNIPTFYFPVMWFRQAVKMPPSLHLLLKIFLHMKLILRCIGAVMVIVGLPWLFALLRPSFSQKTCWKSTKDTYATTPAPHFETSESGKPLMDSKNSTELR